MTSADLNAALAVTLDLGWGDLRPHYGFCLNQVGCHPFIAEVDGAVVGTAVAIQKGDVGWLGYAIVGSQLRRRGIGTTLTSTVADHLEELGCQTLLLIATELGRPVYERLGFALDGYCHALVGPSLPRLPSDPRLRPLLTADLHAICELDRCVTSEDRSPHIRAFGRERWVLAGDDGVRSYFVPTPWGEGPAAALHPADGCVLLDVVRAIAGRRGQSETRIVLPAGNLAGREYLLSAGFLEVGRATRMARGAPLEWHPERIWGRFAGGLG